MIDYGQRETDAVIGRMDRMVADIYRQTEKELQNKLDDYLSRFKVKDQIKREMLRKGEITPEEYNYWRTGQIMIGKRWEEMRDTIAQDLHNANNIARSTIYGYMPEVYALNHNYATFQVEKGSMLDTSYTLYDRQTVERIMRSNPDLLPPPGPRKKAEIAAGKDIKWQSRQLQSAMTKSILMGDSIPHIAKRLSNELSVTNRKAAERYARTAATGAQNAGRVDAYKRAQDMGIEMEQEWLATLDGRTRHEHRYLDGQHVPVGKPFTVDGYELRFPGDPAGPGYLIWNCRCTLVPRLKNLDQSDAPRKSKLGDMSYEEWKNEHASSDNGPEVYKPNTVEYKKVKINSDDWEQWAVDPEPYQDALLHGDTTKNAGWGVVSEQEQDRILKVAQQMQVDASTHIYKDHVTVYRGESFASVDEAKSVYKTGGTFTTHKLTSTATKRDIAQEYAEMGPGINVLHIIDNPGGVRGIMTDPMGIGGSDEIIMPVGNVYRITSSSWDESTNTLKVFWFSTGNKKLNSKDALELLERVKRGEFRR